MEPTTLDDIRAAERRLRGRLVRTACSETEGLGLPCSCRLHLKLESQQKTGSFKERGALNRLLLLDEKERRRGVIAASAGNHGLALAFHGSKLGVPVTVVMPETAPLVKVVNTRGYGARVILFGKVLDESAERAAELAEAEDLLVVPPFNDPHVIAGQGTVGLEILEAIPSPACVVVPVGGGGLVGGTALALKELVPGVRVIGVQAMATPSAHAALAKGEVVTVQPAETLADGIATKRVGSLTYPLLRKYVDDLVLVSEDEIASAILLLLERARIVVEGAGAVGLAALMAGRIDGISGSDDVVAVISGGNIDVTRIDRIIRHGLAVDGRVAHFAVRGPDRPGLLARIAATVARLGGNIMEVDHERDSSEIAVGWVGIVVVVESEGRAHAERIARALAEEGLKVTPVEAKPG